jgi:thiol-disulfide isomerase/thioredoxin
MHLILRRFLPCLALLLLLVASATAQEAGATDMTGMKAPDFTLKGTDGTPYVLSDLYKNKGVFLNFWGVRCGPCVQEIPLLNRIAKTYGPKGLVLLGINLDGIDAETLLPVMKELSISTEYPVLTDTEMAMLEAYRIEGAPLSVFIDSSGTIKYYHVGYTPGDEKKYEEAIGKILPRP